MKIPQGMTESQLIEMIQKIAKRLAPRYTFGYYGIEDIRQEAFLFGLSGLEEYDGVRPLENFLCVHIKNRLYNFRRDNFMRLPGLCKHCQNIDSENCARCRKKEYTKNSKKCIMEPLDISNIQPDYEQNLHILEEPVSLLEINETLQIIDNNLSLELRPDYLRMKAGVTVPKHKRLRVEQAITEILEGSDEKAVLNEKAVSHEKR